jgi:diguanylate cyclase (GGDEF)-like protein
VDALLGPERIDAARESADGGARQRDIRRLDGRESHVLSATLALEDDHHLLLIVDLTERVAAERALKHLALHDPTTGVPNRRLLMDRMEQALARASREHLITGVLFCDIDQFKRVNDTYGHRIGDLVLQTAAARLASVLRRYDTVARVGGDEFVILLERLSDPTDATRLAERARVALHEPMEIEQRQLRITVSIGVATSVGSDDVDAVLRCADDAMYVAKARGRNRVDVLPTAERP